MENPQNYFIEFSFYFSEYNDMEGLAYVTKKLLEMGAALGGEITIHKGNHIVDRPFYTSINEGFSIERINIKEKDIQEFFNDKNIRVSEIKMMNATGLYKNVYDILTFNVIHTKQALEQDHHSISIYTDGSPLDDTEKNRNIKFGFKCYKRFIEFVNHFKPSYAAILVEEPLPCPLDLRYDKRLYHYLQNFYISASYFDNVKMNKLKTLYKEVYQEKLEDGIYISTHSLFNPSRISLDYSLIFDLSYKTSKMISSLAKEYFY